MNHARLACLVALLLFASLTAQAQSNAPPPSAAKEGGGTPEGDPSGAVRALGSADETKTKGTVTVPDAAESTTASDVGRRPTRRADQTV